MFFNDFGRQSPWDFIPTRYNYPSRGLVTYPRQSRSMYDTQRKFLEQREPRHKIWRRQIRRERSQQIEKALPANIQKTDYRGINFNGNLHFLS